VKLQIQPDFLRSSAWMMAEEVQMTHDQPEIHRKKRISDLALLVLGRRRSERDSLNACSIAQVGSD
jgi:hypothetical protein